MQNSRAHVALAVALLVLVALTSSAQETPSEKHREKAKKILWVDPGDIRSRNLYWGPGGKEHQAELPVEFEKEDRHGTSPKFDVRDSGGKKWGAKLGLEAKPEIAAARLLWAVGYGANENYFFPELEVKNMPLSLHRGNGLLGKGGHIPNVRLQRPPHGYKKDEKWNWRHNDFYGTREFNGLRVMMGLIGNWDLKDDNNAVLKSETGDGPKIYEVTDVGTSMGTPGKSYTDKVSKGNLKVYRRTRLIKHDHGDHIDLNFPKRPPIAELFEFEWAFFFHQLNMRWIGEHIPRKDAKWIGSLLAQLSAEQISDAFRAANYSQAEIEAYTESVRSRIKELNDL
jgi:hypothetical protein